MGRGVTSSNNGGCQKFGEELNCASLVEIRSETRRGTNQQRLSGEERGASGGLTIADARNEAMSDMNCSTYGADKKLGEEIR